ncbi:unnamed protein product [Closterium sp. NIES-53]
MRLLQLLTLKVCRPTQRVSICTCTQMGRHLATGRPGSSLYTLTTEPAQVAAFAQVSASGPVVAPSSCHLLSHQTLLWHHRLGHPSLPRLRGMHSRLLASGLSRSLPPLPPSPAPPCLPCVEGRLRAAPHSLFPPMTAPLQTLHMDVWGPARVSGQDRERYFLLVVDDYTHYTTVLPLRNKGKVPDDLIPWIRAVRLQLREWFREDLPVLRLHSDRGAPHWLSHGGGLIIEVVRTSMIHAAAPHFLWPFAVRALVPLFAILPRTSSPPVLFLVSFLSFPLTRLAGSFTTPPRAASSPLRTSRLTSRFPFIVSSPTALPLSPPPPPLFLARGPPPVEPLPPQGSALSGVSQVDPIPGTVPVEVAVDSGAARGAASGGVASGGAEPASVEPGGAEPEGVESGGAEPEGAESGGAEPGGTEPEGAEPGGAESEGAESRGAEPRGTAFAGGSAGASPRRSPRQEPLSSQQLREWFAQRTRLRSGAAGAGGSAAGGTGAGGAGATSLGGAGVTVGAGGTRGPGAAGGGGVGDSGAGDPGAGGSGAGGAGAGGTGAGGAGASSPGGAGVTAGLEVLGVLELPELVVLEALELETLEVEALALETLELEALALEALELEEVELEALELEALELEVLALEVLELAVLVLEALCSGARFSFCRSRRLYRHLTRSFAKFLLQPHSPLPAPSPYVEQTFSFTERREPESRPASPVCAVCIGRHIPRPRPPPVPGTHIMALRPSSVPLRVPLPSPPASSLADGPDPESDLVCAASPTILRLLATVVTDPSFESTAASALVAELVDIAAANHLDYIASLVAESKSDCPPSVGGECALGTDVLEDRQEDFECLITPVPHLVAMLLAPEGDPDAPDIPTSRSYAEAIMGTYIDAIPPSRENIEDSMWIFRVKRPPGSPPVFKARYVARGFSHRHGVDFFQTFSPTPKMTTPRVLLHVAAQRDYELHSPDFSYGLREAPREWHDTLRTTLAALGFAPSTADPSLFLRTDTSLPPFYILVYVDDLVFATADTEALALVKSELQKRHTCTDLGELRSYLGLQITRDKARHTITLTQSHMVHQVLQRFGFRYSSPQSTPLPIGHSLSARPSDEFVEPSGPYPELVGCLMFLMTCTRPDLAYPLSILARYVVPERQRPEHWEAAKRVLRYLCSTSGMGLVLGGRGPVILTGHADASWVDDLATQWSPKGYTFSHGSGFVSWRSNRSSSVLSCNSEAKIYVRPWLHRSYTGSPTYRPT